MSDNIPKDAYAIIIGAMKCGTTSLYDYLIKHPEICPSISKEPEFFSENQSHGVKVVKYSDLWSFDNSIHKYALEASTGYTKYPTEPNVPRNIFNYGISPKFIYIMRNPFDRISSHYNFMQKDKSWRLQILDAHLLGTTNYFIQLEQFRKYFPLQDILLLDFDELKENPAKVLKKTYEFLGLSYHYFPEKYEVKNVTPIESEAERNLRRSKSGIIFGYLPKPIKKAGKKFLHIISPPAKRALTDKEREMVYNEIKESMSNLYRIYGFDVSKWGFDAQ